MEDNTQNIVMKEIEKTLRMLHNLEKKIKLKYEEGEKMEDGSSRKDI